MYPNIAKNDPSDITRRLLFARFKKMKTYGTDNEITVARILKFRLLWSALIVPFPLFLSFETRKASEATQIVEKAINSTRFICTPQHKKEIFYMIKKLRTTFSRITG
jgi:hypothetical protein